MPVPTYDGRRVAFRGRYVFPIDAPPIEDGELVIANGQIVGADRAAHGSDSLDLGNVAILPALINAHTHLEFSQLKNPLGAAGISFCDWIRAVLAYREQHPCTASAGIRAGLDESVRAGTAMLGEIATCPPEKFSDYASTASTVLFSEMIGLSSARVGQQLSAARKLTKKSASNIPQMHIGLSPHAPYTAHATLVGQVAQLSADRRFTVAMHLAETSEEIRLLRDQSGPIQELLAQRNLWEPSAFRKGMRPLDYLRLLAAAHRSLVIHGNFLDDDEIRFLGNRPHRMSLVYCPRTHAYFGHPRYPLRKMLDFGVNLAIGTDSRASNPDLSLLSEMRYVARNFSDVSSDEILRMGTIRGAAALGADDILGTLSSGKHASFIAVRLPPQDQPDVGRLVLESELPLELVVFSGQPIYATESTASAVCAKLS